MQERGTVAPLRTKGDVHVPRVARRKRLATVVSVALFVLCADQLTKSLAVSHLSGRALHVIGPFSLELAFNSGVAFSLLSGFGFPIIVVTLVLVVVLVWFTRGLPSYPAVVGVGMILGGAIGNLSDRLFRGHGGAVVDFIHTGFWPTFNVAASSVVCGCALLIIASLRHSPNATLDAGRDHGGSDAR